MRRPGDRRRLRRMRLGVYHVEASPRWEGSTLKFLDTSGTERKEVVLRISAPSDLEYLEERIEQIRAYWRRQLGV